MCVHVCACVCVLAPSWGCSHTGSSRQRGLASLECDWRYLCQQHHVISAILTRVTWCISITLTSSHVMKYISSDYRSDMEISNSIERFTGSKNCNASWQFYQIVVFLIRASEASPWIGMQQHPAALTEASLPVRAGLDLLSYYRMRSVLAYKAVLYSPYGKSSSLDSSPLKVDLAFPFPQKSKRANEF